MSRTDLKWACHALSQLDPDKKYHTMIMTAAIITKLLEKEQIKPIIVGGFSVEIYTDEDYSTRDIDFVVNDWSKTVSLLEKLGFDKVNQNLLHKELEIVIDYNGHKLAGSMDKVNKVYINTTEGLYVYVISYEDIIMDRLRAYLYWGEDDSKEWGMQMLAIHYNKLDQQYMKEIGKGAENEQETAELIKWFEELGNLKSE